MKIDNVTSAEKRKDGSVALTIFDPFDGSKELKEYAAIRGGISWPTAKAPAYFCVVGKEYVNPGRNYENEQNGAMTMLAEYETNALSLTGFYKKIIDCAEQMLCDSFYVELPEDRNECGFLNDFDDVESKRESNTYLWEAHDVDNFLLGVSRIRSCIDQKQLIIPGESITAEQMNSFTREDLQFDPKENFYAVNALRHVVGSYYREPVGEGPIITRKRKKSL